MSAMLLFDLSDWSVLSITGPDRATFLHSFCTNDIKRLQPGQGCEAFVTSIKGRILGHVLVFAGQEKLTLVAVPGSNVPLLPHLTKYLIGVEAEVHDETGQYAVLCVAGENAARAMNLMASPPVTFGGCITPDDNWVKAAGELGLTGTVKNLAESVPGDNVPAGEWLLGRADMFRVPGFLCLGPVVQKDDVMTRLTGAGATLSDLDRLHSLRSEAGFPWHGVDITDDNLAQEAGRTDRTISFRKGCYLGQEPIARLDSMGHTNRELRGLLIPGSEIPARGASVVHNGVEVGKVTSAAPSTDGQSAVALALIRIAAASSGTSVTVQIGERQAAATVYWPKL